MRPSFPQASFFSPLRSTFFHLFPRRPSLPSMSSKSGQKTGWEKSKSEPYSMDGRTSLNLLLPPPHNFSSDPAGKPRRDAYPVRVIASSADRVNPGQRRRCRQQRREHACAERIDAGRQRKSRQNRATPERREVKDGRRVFHETLISSSMPALISIPLTIRFVKSPFWVEFSRVFPFSGLLFQFSKFFSSLFFQELILLLLSHLVYEPAKNQLPIANADPLSRSDRFLIA